MDTSIVEKAGRGRRVSHRHDVILRLRGEHPAASSRELAALYEAETGMSIYHQHLWRVLRAAGFRGAPRVRKHDYDVLKRLYEQNPCATRRELAGLYTEETGLPISHFFVADLLRRFGAKRRNQYHPTRRHVMISFSATAEMVDGLVKEAKARNRTVPEQCLAVMQAWLGTVGVVDYTLPS